MSALLVTDLGGGSPLVQYMSANGTLVGGVVEQIMRCDIAPVGWMIEAGLFVHMRMAGDVHLRRTRTGAA